MLTCSTKLDVLTYSSTPECEGGSELCENIKSNTRTLPCPSHLATQPLSDSATQPLQVAEPATPSGCVAGGQVAEWLSSCG